LSQPPGSPEKGAVDKSEAEGWGDPEGRDGAEGRGRSEGGGGEEEAEAEGRGYRALETLAHPYRPDFGAPQGGVRDGIGGGSRSGGGWPAGGPRWDGTGPMGSPGRGGGGRSRSGGILVLVIGIAIGILLASAILILPAGEAGLSPLLLAVALAALFGPVLSALLALRLARALAPSEEGAPGLGGAGSAEAAADAANAAPDALAVTDMAGQVLFANRRMRRLVPGLLPGAMDGGAALPDLLQRPGGTGGPGEGGDGADLVLLADGGEAWLEVWPLPHPEGRRLWRLLPLADAVGEEGPDRGEGGGEAAGAAAGPAWSRLLDLAMAADREPGMTLHLAAGEPGPGAAEADLSGPFAGGPHFHWRQGPDWRAAGWAPAADGPWLWLIARSGSGTEALPRGLAGSPVCAVVLDAQARVRAANPAFAAMSGWGGETVALSGLLADGEAEAGAGAGAGAGALTHALADAQGQGPDGRPATLRFSRHPERSVHLYVGPPGEEGPGEGDGTASRLALLIDVTEQKGVEQQVAHGQKMQAIGQLAGGVAHDFNNLLTAMIGFCDLLLQRHPPTDQSFADVQQIKQNALRAAGLVRQLLAFSRRQTLRPRSMDVTDVLADLRHLLSRLIGEKIRLQILHGRDLGIVRVDRGQLEQVIINLAVNARDAMREGGTLTITTSVEELAQPQDRGSDLVPAGRYVRIDVADTGTGVPQEHADKIFEPFFTTKKPGEGTGLGLSTVYGIIRQTGGFVFLDRNGSDGATFSILLPEAAPDLRADGDSGAEARPAAVPRDLTGRETLLLVEDEDAVRLFAARSLRNKGYTVMEAASGEAALELSRDHAGPIHALVTDVVMPNMDGPTLAQQILKDRPGTALVFMSGYAEDAVRQAISGGELPAAFLQKPFTLNELAVTVRAALSDPESVDWMRPS